MKSFFVMGGAKIIECFSETESGKRRLNFEPLVSHGLSLERHSTLGEGSISLRAIRLGAVDGAPSTCCAKHSSVNFFDVFRAPDSMRKKSSRGLPGASGGLQGPSRGFQGLFRKKIKILFSQQFL